MKKTIAFAVCIIILAASCKKEAKSTCGKTMAEVAGTYSYTKIQFRSGGATTDITGTMDVCILDNKMILNTDGTAKYSDEGVDCGRTGSGHWNIGADGKLHINVGTVVFEDADVTSFDCSTIVFEEEDGLDMVYISTIKK